MSPESLIAAAVSFFLALLAVWGLLAPFCRSDSAAAEGADERRERRDALLMRKESALSGLEELEEDHVTKRITDAEYQQGRESLTAEAGEYMESLERLDQAATKPSVTTLPRSGPAGKRKRK